MLKKNWKVLLFTSVIILLPVLFGVLLWNELPESIPSHWNIHGEVDGWNSKPMAVFGMPLILLAIQWLCVFVTQKDPKNKDNSEKILRLVFWIIPVLSLLLFTVTYFTAMGKAFRVEKLAFAFIGILFFVIGNYLPKCKQNYTIGIKIPWTLNSEENWNKTHRLAGFLWVLGGIAFICLTFFSFAWLVLPVCLILCLVPVFYSYFLHRKGI